MLIRKKLQADRRDKKDWHGQGNLPGKLASGAKIAYNVMVYLFAFPFPAGTEAKIDLS